MSPMLATAVLRAKPTLNLVAGQSLIVANGPFQTSVYLPFHQLLANVTSPGCKTTCVKLPCVWLSTAVLPAASC